MERRVRSSFALSTLCIPDGQLHHLFVGNEKMIERCCTRRCGWSSIHPSHSLLGMSDLGRWISSILVCVCVCVCVRERESACVSSISIWRRRKGEQGQTGGRMDGRVTDRGNGRQEVEWRNLALYPPPSPAFLSRYSYCILEPSSRTFRRAEKGVVLSCQQIYKHNNQISALLLNRKEKIFIYLILSAINEIYWC